MSRILTVPRPFLVIATAVLALRGLEQAARAAETPEAEVLFAQKVWPLLSAKCLACHGADEKKLRGGFDLRTRTTLLRGGDSGQPGAAPGQPERSPLYLAVTRQKQGLVMPPKENDKLSAEEVEWVRRWIAAGAPWPAPAKTGAPADDAEGVRIATSGGRSPEWTNRRYRPEDVWAYQPVRKPAIPTSAGTAHPINAFIQDKLRTRGLRPAAPADRRTLIRRLTFDLTGLPPTPQEIDAFLNDTRTDAHEHLIQRLLSSPHYGEQQARHWFDVVRYADTSGFANDFERPHAWRYRDYVIRSFNTDKPQDRFILEQLAGDELDSSDSENLLAVGFLRMGPWEHTGMTVAAITRQQFLDDVTHSVGVTFLGQGLRCAACHDHKFDPLPTRDYYRLQAVFAPTQFAERPLPFQERENAQGFAAAQAVVRQRLDRLSKLQDALRQKSDAAVAALLRQHGVTSVEQLPPGERPRKDYLGPTQGLSNTDLSLRKIYKRSEDYLKRELRRFEPFAYSVYSGPPNNYSSVRLDNPIPAQPTGVVPVVHILPGGSLEAPADAVTPGVLSAVFGSNDLEQPAKGNTIPATVTGRRLALARWIASPENPLTARVIVNRIWQQHFGRGLVATPNNFGKMGARPTHPELLDWLAAWFVENGWSVKKLHRLLVTSATYRQASDHPDSKRLQQLDPRNHLLACYPPRRLAAEEIRDAQLAVSGELNRTLGGPGVFPEINWEAAFQPRHVMGSVAPAYLPSLTPAERNRRTLYAFRYRTLADPMLEVLNRPGSDISCERREQTTVTPQVFALFNSAFSHNRALAFAAALERQAPTLSGRIETAFRLAYGRPPTAEEADACAAHMARMTEQHRRNPPPKTELPTTVKRGMVEELTGETVTWEEDLSPLAQYQRDLMPWQVGPETRALAEVCLVLFNSNEFLFVR